MFSQLSGSYSSQKPTQSDPLPSPNEPVFEIPDFQQTRNFLYFAGVESFKSKQPISLLVLAIDEFERFKFNYGQDAAAKACHFIEETLCHHRDLIFGPDSGVVVGHYVLGRYLIVLPGISGAIACDYAEYLCKTIIATAFAWNYRSLYFTVSIGIAHKPGHAGDQDMLILQADETCDQIMACGGNRVAVAKISTHLE